MYLFLLYTIGAFLTLCVRISYVYLIPCGSRSSRRALSVPFIKQTFWRRCQPCSSERPCLVALYNTKFSRTAHPIVVRCFTSYCFTQICFSILLAWEVLRSLGNRWDYLKTTMNTCLFKLITILFFVERYLLV